jgi:hypothetical protein
VLIALAAVLFGGMIYLYPPAVAGFPINDGGLFYVMIRSIQQNAYRLPEFVHYNGLFVPFAYPPLAFYTAALISGLLHLDPRMILLWFPGIVLIAISIGVYLLARRILTSPIEAGIATFVYVCIPRSMTWLIMGGGLTRGLGQLFMVLAAASVYALYTQRSRWHLLGAAGFASLAVLSHPEAALHTAALCVLLWLFKGRSRRGIMDSISVAGAVVGLSALWWLPALQHFGLRTFMSAGQTGLNSPILIAYALLLTFTEEPMMTIIAALGLVGLVACVARGQYLLPAWMLLPFLVEPRGAPTVAIVPLAFMASIALHEVIFPAISGIEQRTRGVASSHYGESAAVKLFAAYVGLLMLELSLFAGSQLAQIKVSDANMAAFEWVIASTPANSQMLVMTGDIELFCDPIQEWFPALTQRTSATTIQGQEWTSDGRFFSKVAAFQQIQDCMQADSPLECVKQRSASAGANYKYIYVAQAATTKRFCRPTGDERRGAALIMQLRTSPEYANVYSSEDVQIFRKNP